MRKVVDTSYLIVMVANEVGMACLMLAILQTFSVWPLIRRFWPQAEDRFLHWVMTPLLGTFSFGVLLLVLWIGVALIIAGGLSVVELIGLSWNAIRGTNPITLILIGFGGLGITFVAGVLLFLLDRWEKRMLLRRITRSNELWLEDRAGIARLAERR